jgi:hypothetical protein
MQALRPGASRRFGNELPKPGLATVLVPDPVEVCVVQWHASKILNPCGDSSRAAQVASGVLVAPATGPIEREVDHRTQEQGSCERVTLSKLI